MHPKRKVSISIAADLLDELDRRAGSGARSAVFEQALEHWLRERRRLALDRAIESYYRSMPEAERREDEAWASVGDDTVTRRWGD